MTTMIFAAQRAGVSGSGHSEPLAGASDYGEGLGTSADIPSASPPPTNWLASSGRCSSAASPTMKTRPSNSPPPAPPGD